MSTYTNQIHVYINHVYLGHVKWDKTFKYYDKLYIYDSIVTFDKIIYIARVDHTTTHEKCVSTVAL